MNSDPGRRLYELCDALFNTERPADHIDGKTVRALSPNCHFFHITRSRRHGDVPYMLHWLPPTGKGGWWGTSPSHREAQLDPNDHEVSPPPQELLDELAHAIPFPADREWGMVERGAITQMVLFNGRRFSEVPGGLFVVARGIGTALRNRLYNGEWLNLSAFWEAVQRRTLVSIHNRLVGRRLQLGQAGDDWYLFVGDDVFAQPRLWDRYPGLSTTNHPGRLKDIHL